MICSGSEAGSYLRLIDVFIAYRSTLGLIVIKKKREDLMGPSLSRIEGL